METRYPDVEKFAYALVIAARKLRLYFQGRTITMLTDKLLRKILHKPELSGRMVTWVVELGEFDIRYKPRTAIKGRALADFVAEFSFTNNIEKEENPEQLTLGIEIPTWTLYVDGSSTAERSGVGLILTSTEDFVIQ